MNKLPTLIRIVLGLFILVFIILGINYFRAKPAADHSYFNPDDFLVIAHRGGRGIGPESTLYTFQRAVDMGVDVLEMDVHSTKDGQLVILHDATLNRTTNAIGRANEYTLAELKKLDAAYRWSPTNIRAYPLRNKNITIPALNEVFKTFPETRLNIEIKESNQDVVPSLCRLIRDYNMTKKVMVASFDAGVLKEFRTMCPEVATSAGASEATYFYVLQKLHLEATYSPRVKALQVPESYGDLNVVNRRFIEAAHSRNLRVHVWTVNDVTSMKRLLALGVDGIMTDYPDRLIGLLNKH